MNVLIIEDERDLADEIEQYLKKEKFVCEKAYSGKEASEKLAVSLFDFVLLDLGLPDMDGIDLLREGKKANEEAAFIVITARNSVNDKVKGLDLGADDYLAKPFSLLEMHARIQAVARRKFNITNPDLRLGGFTLNLSGRKLLFNDKEVALTKKEFELLHYLGLHRNKVLTRMQLVEHIWGNIVEDINDSNYVDVHIKNVRKKLQEFEDPAWLETVRGVGYRVNA
jgi:DNA-binding response OmpR family regulator